MFNLISNIMARTSLFLTTVNTEINTDVLVGGIMDVLITVAKYSGIVMLAIGVIQFLFAYKDENADAQTKAVRLMIVGGCLVGVRVFLQVVGIISTSVIFMPLF